MYEVGRLCVKIAGRDAKGKCVIVDIVDKNSVLIDGQVRRRKCNIKHLEPLNETVKIKKNASHSDVVKALDAMGIKVVDTKKREAKAKPGRARASKKKPETAEPAEKETAKKKKEKKK
ncbi:MAG: large subunit ribosomal protein L14e [archaeon GW2011_AR3]|nr:MAG: large subunit ribosomal protein L14e [archaeon GW2011_AR3]